MQTEWVLRGAEILISLFYFGFGIANARSSGPIIDSLRTRQLPLPRLLFWAGVTTQSIAGLLAKPACSIESSLSVTTPVFWLLC